MIAYLSASLHNTRALAHTLEVAARRLRGACCNTDSLHNDCLSVCRCDLDVNAASTKSGTVLEEVVWLASGSFPGLSVIGRDVEAGDGDVGVHDLHAEPVRRSAFLVLEDDRRGDATGHNGVANGDDALRLGAELGESVLEQVELRDCTLRALVHNLR